MSQLHLSLLLAGIAAGAVLVAVLILRANIVDVPSGFAAVIARAGRQSRVSFGRTLLVPLLERAELMDIRTRTLRIDRRGSDGVICRDRIRADLAADFTFHVNRTQEDVLRVARAVGCARASDAAALESLFAPRFAAALKTVAATVDFSRLIDDRERFTDEIIEVIGADLDGFVLDGLAIDYVEQTPRDALDPTNILDAEGIAKIDAIAKAQALIAKRIGDDRAPDRVAAALDDVRRLLTAGGRERSESTETSLGAPITTISPGPVAPIDQASLLPPAQAQAFLPGGSARLQSTRLVVGAPGAAEAAIDLSAPWRAALTRRGTALVLEVHQQRLGVDLTLRLAAPLADTLRESAERADSRLPSLDAAAPEPLDLPAADLRQLLAHLHHVTKDQGTGSWSGP